MKTVQALVVDLLIIALVYAGFFLGVQGARNVLLFFVWMSVALGLLYVMFSSDEKYKEFAANKSPLPAWWSVPKRIAILAVFVWFAWWLTAAGYAIAWILFAGAQLRGKELIEQAKAAQ